MEWPKISVVTPSFNQAEFLPATLESVANQNYPNLEHIVIDGGSTDGSRKILEENSDNFAYWVSEPDSGHTDALIKGFARATGDIQCWLNSDDLFEPGTLLAVATWFMAHPDAQVVYGDATWVDISGVPIRRNRQHAFNRFVWLYCYNFISQPSTFWRTELYQAVGGLDPQFDLAMDADLWIRFAEYTRVHHVRTLWSRERRHPEQRNQLLREYSNIEDGIIRDRYLKHERESIARAKRGFAIAYRIALKVVQGCYW